LRSTLIPYTTLFRSGPEKGLEDGLGLGGRQCRRAAAGGDPVGGSGQDPRRGGSDLRRSGRLPGQQATELQAPSDSVGAGGQADQDRKSTRLNSSHVE